MRLLKVNKSQKQNTQKNFSQKRTDEFVLFAFLLFTANKSNSSVRFLGESTARQSPFWFYLTFSTLHQNDLKKMGPLVLLILIWNGIYYSVFLFWLQTQRREKFDYAVTIFAYGFLLLHLTPSCHKWAAQLGCKVSVLGLRD